VCATETENVDVHFSIKLSNIKHSPIEIPFIFIVLQLTHSFCGMLKCLAYGVRRHRDRFPSVYVDLHKKVSACFSTIIFFNFKKCKETLCDIYTRQ
jgi:hypothetical protein